MTDKKTVQISLSDAETLALDALTFNGVKEEAAKAVVETYLEAEKCGKPSHGLQLIPWVLKQFKKTHPQTPYALCQRENSILMDGAENPGPYVAKLLVEKLIGITEESMIAIGGIRNAGHIGMLSYYANLFTAKKRIALIFATTPSVTVPHQGKEPVLGTNPLCMGVPTQGDPIILDMSTTAITYHSVLRAKESGEQLPPNVVLDKAGNPTQDPQLADTTRLLTFGGYKGFGLSLMVELLTGALTGWKVGAEKARDIENDRFSTTMIAMRSDVFIGQSSFFGRTETLKQDIAMSQEQEEARLPFSHSMEMKRKAEESDLIEVPTSVVETLKTLTQSRL